MGVVAAATYTHNAALLIFGLISLMPRIEENLQTNIDLMTRPDDQGVNPINSALFHKDKTITKFLAVVFTSVMYVST